MKRMPMIAAAAAAAFLPLLPLLPFMPLMAQAQPSAAPPPTPSPISFVAPKDGATVRSPFVVKLDVVGKEVTKGGADMPNAGHYVLIVNGEPVAKGQRVPADAMHIHWKNGQTEEKVRLPAGAYRLTAQFVTGERESYGPALSRTIAVAVK